MTLLPQRLILAICQWVKLLLPRSPSVAFGDGIPGRNHRLLPALAKNMPLPFFLDASRLPEGAVSEIAR